jgi:hypothetical protein
MVSLMRRLKKLLLQMKINLLILGLRMKTLAHLRELTLNGLIHQIMTAITEYSPYIYQHLMVL